MRLNALRQVLIGDRISKRQLHYLLTHCHMCDVAKSGTFSLTALLFSFRAINIVLPGGAKLRPGFKFAPIVPPPPPLRISLEEYRDGRKVLYRDPETGLVYGVSNVGRERQMDLKFKADGTAVLMPQYDVVGMGYRYMGCNYGT